MMICVVPSFPLKNIHGFIKARRKLSMIFFQNLLSDHFRKVVKHSMVCYANYTKNGKQNSIHDSANSSFEESLFHVDLRIGSLSQTNLESLS